MMRRAILLIGVAWAAGWWIEQRSRPPATSLLLVTIDTLRADHVGAYGYRPPTTPHLDAVAREGTVFETAYTPTPTTGPSHATLLTSRYPAAHGVLKNGLPLLPDAPTLAEVLHAAGWRTAAVVSALPLAARFGYDRGFETYDDAFPPATASIASDDWEGVAVPEAFDRRADATTDRAVSWLTAAPRPFFLWVHYYDPHAPYDPPPGFEELVREGGDRGSVPPLARKIVAYDAEIRFVDEQVARLLRAAEARAGTGSLLTVLASDHGEGLMSHGWMEHGVNLYDELVRTVLVLRWPGHIRPAQRVREPVGLIDVAPTILALLGQPAAALRPQGDDLSRVVLDGVAPPADRTLFFRRRLYTERDEREWPAVGEMFGVRRDGWKYIAAPSQGTTELFDLARDPGETHDLHADAGGVEAVLAAAVDRWAAAEHDPPAAAVAADDAARLRALGYVQ